MNRMRKLSFGFLYCLFILFFLVPIQEVSADELLNRYLKKHYPGIKPEWVYMQEAETFDWIGGRKFVKIGPVKGASDGWAIEVENKVDGIFLHWGKHLLDKTSLVKHIPYQYLARIKIPEIKNPEAPVFKVDSWEVSANGLPENQWVLVPIPAPSYLYTLKDACCDKFYLDSYYFVPLINDAFVSDKDREKFFAEWEKIKRWKEEIASITKDWNPETVPRPETFVYGVWTGGKEDIFRLRVDSCIEAGMNLIMIPGGIWRWKEDYEDRLAYLSRFGEKEPYLMVGIQHTLQSKLPREREKQLSFPCPLDEFKLLLEKKIKPGINNPKLLGGWYIFDEPGMGDIQQIRIAQSLLYEVDPHHSIQVALNAPCTIWALGPYIPILMTDYYSNSFEGLERRLKYSLHKSSTKDVWWMPSGISPWGYFPSPEDDWLYNHMAIGLGIKGIVYHLYNSQPYWSPGGSWNREAYKFTIMDTFNHPTPTWEAISEMGVYFSALGELLYESEPIKKTLEISNKDIGYGWLKDTKSEAEYIVVYNKNRKQEVTTKLKIASPELYDLYSLIDNLLCGKKRMKPFSGNLSLEPGKGKILALCRKETMEQRLLPSISRRLYEREKNIFITKYNLASAHNLDIKKVKNEWGKATKLAEEKNWEEAFNIICKAKSEAKNILQSIRETEKKIDDLRLVLHKCGVSLKKYNWKKMQKPPFKPLAENLLSLSKRYYELLFKYRKGDSSDELKDSLDSLLQESLALCKKIEGIAK